MSVPSVGRREGAGEELVSEWSRGRIYEGFAYVERVREMEVVGANTSNDVIRGMSRQRKLQGRRERV